MAFRPHICVDPGTPRGQKKLIESALLQIAQEGQTSDEWFILIYKTKLINDYLGTSLTTGDILWQPDEVIERILGLAEDLPGILEGQQRVEEIREKWKREAGLK